MNSGTMTAEQGGRDAQEVESGRESSWLLRTGSCPACHSAKAICRTQVQANVQTHYDTSFPDSMTLVHTYFSMWLIFFFSSHFFF